MGMTIAVGAGTGRLSRHGNDLLFVPRMDDGGAALVAAFRDVGDDVVDALTQVMVERDFDVPAFACVAGGPRITLLVFGDVEVQTDHPAVSLLSGASSQTWVEHTLRGEVSEVTVAVTPADVADGTDLVTGTVPASGFRAVVSQSEDPASRASSAESPGRAGVKTGDRDEASPSRASGPERGAPLGVGPKPSAPSNTTATTASEAAVASGSVDASADGGVDELAEDSGGDLLDAPVGDGLEAIQAAAVTGDDAAAAGGSAGPTAQAPVVGQPPGAATPAPTDAQEPSGQQQRPNDRGSAMVEAVHCASGHANQPGTSACRECGASLPDDAVVRTVQRPVLGRLVLDGGKALVLNRNYVLGRKPTATPPAVAAPLEGEKISRNHLAVELRGWDVHVRDLGSTNGTYLSASDGQPWQQIQSEVDVRITPGATLRIDQHTLTFEEASNG